MPQIIVTADGGAAFGDGAVTLRERVNVADFESQHFATQLVERLGWAVSDADQAEQFENEEFSDRTPGDPDRTRDGKDPIPGDPDRIPDDQLNAADPAATDTQAATDSRVTAPSPA